MKWPKACLGEVAQVVSGATPKSSIDEYWDGDIPWITPADLSKLEAKEVSTTSRQITEAGLASCSARILPARSVLFSSRAPIGHVAINAVPMATNQGFKSLVPDQKLVNPDFLYWWLKSNKSYLQSLGRGATFKEVSKEIVESIEIPLPPLEEQRRIAAILDRAAMVREQATQSLAATSRSLYDSIFSRDILAAHHRMARIGDIAEQLPSGYGSDPGRLPFAAPVAKVSNVTADGRFHRGFESRSFTQSELERLLVGEHDLLVVKSSGSKANIISGKTAICGKNEAGVLVASNFLMRLCIDRSAADPRFVWHILNSRISKDFVKRVAGTTTYPNLKWSTYVDHPIPLPSLSEQLLIRERLDCIDALSHEKGARLAEKAGDLIAVLQQQLIGR